MTSGNTKKYWWYPLSYLEGINFTTGDMMDMPKDILKLYNAVGLALIDLYTDENNDNYNTIATLEEKKGILKAAYEEKMAVQKGVGKVLDMDKDRSC